MHKYTNAQIHKCTNTQMHKCTNAQIHKYTNTNTNTLIQICPEIDSFCHLRSTVTYNTVHIIKIQFIQPGQRYTVQTDAQCSAMHRWFKGKRILYLSLYLYLCLLLYLYFFVFVFVYFYICISFCICVYFCICSWHLAVHSGERDRSFGHYRRWGVGTPPDWLH